MANSHPFSSTLIDFELLQIFMRVNESLCAFDQSIELMRVAKLLQVCSWLIEIVQNGPVIKHSQQNVIFTSLKNVQLKKLQALFE